MDNIDDVYDLNVSLHENDISNRDKSIVKEVIKILENNQHKSFENQKTLLLETFHIEKMPEEKVEDSLWYKFTQDYPLGASKQGFKIVEKDGRKVKIPFVAFTADTDTLDSFLHDLLNKVADSKSEDKTK
jgi:hypothetical protein